MWIEKERGRADLIDRWGPRDSAAFADPPLVIADSCCTIPDQSRQCKCRSVDLKPGSLPQWAKGNDAHLRLTRLGGSAFRRSSLTRLRIKSGAGLPSPRTTHSQLLTPNSTTPPTLLIQVSPRPRKHRHQRFVLTLRVSVASTTATSTVESITNTVSDAANYVAESVSGALSGASKEANKVRPRLRSQLWSCGHKAECPSLLMQEVAKGNTDASVTDRVSAGFSAVGDK